MKRQHFSIQSFLLEKTEKNENFAEKISDLILFSKSINKYFKNLQISFAVYRKKTV